MEKLKKILLVSLIVIGLGLLIFGAIHFLVQVNNKSVNDIIDILYKNVPANKKAMYYTIDDENFYDFLGNAKFKYRSAVASTPLAEDVIHQVVLIEVEKDADVGKIMQDIANNINFDKYNEKIKAEDVIIKNNGNLIIYIVIEDESVRKIISDEFDRL